ncbi:MAG: NFACT RNA binding domain-containing protein [Candidatus Nanoarchaeia archaeon]|nr:NFACT RNA binding domain-containing protein [Candidatus Nanoarchaeia archaeon]
MEIELDLNKSLEENANIYFDKSKNLKNKIIGAKNFLETSQKKIKKYEKEVKTKYLNYNKQWFEKFRYTISENGFLFIGGKDATSNEIIIKKHVLENEIVLHSSTPGSPFFVLNQDFDTFIKTNTKDLENCANVLFNYSKAFDMDIFSGEVFYVKKEQVTKEAMSGEYMSKGSFMVYGNKNTIKTQLGFFLNILLIDDNFWEIFEKNQTSEFVKKIIEIFKIKKIEGKYYKIFSTSFNTNDKQIKTFYINSGSKKKSEVSNLLMKKFNLFSNQDIISNLPNGNFSIKDMN